MNLPEYIPEPRQLDALSLAGPIVNDREALLILRESYFRVRLFESFLSRLDLSCSLLEEKLHLLVEEGMLRRIAPQEQLEHCEFVLTARGFNFLPTALSILRLYGEGSTERAGRELGGGTVFDGIVNCSDCGEMIAREISWPLSRAQRTAQADRAHSHGAVASLYCDVPLTQ
jgi:DNA-binding HxlR family transcriptional regulator